MPFCLTDENVIGKGLLKRDVIYKMFKVLCLYLTALGYATGLNYTG